MEQCFAHTVWRIEADFFNDESAWIRIEQGF